MIQKINTLLYATDLSNTSVHAFRYAMGLAQSLDARLHLLHVMEPLSDEARMTVQLFIQNPRQREEALSRRREAVQAMLEDRQEKFWAELNGQSAALRDRVGEVEVIEGFPAEEILKRADSLPADMILMGSHHQGIAHTFLGLVAKRVLRRARVPVLIVPYAEHR